MKLVVSNKSQTPIYLQLYQQIVSQILSEELSPEESLPSIRFVAKQLQISVVPVKAAYEKLEQDGYIFTVPGKGCFVAPLQADKNRNMLAQAKLQEALDFCLGLGLSAEQTAQLLEKIVKKR